jgi:hypothetical protein
VDERLAGELARMAGEDQRIRQPKGDRRFVHQLSLAEAMEFTRVDVANTDRLREIIAQHGWPGYELVGETGAEHAWLIAQHADKQLDFQRDARRLLAEAVARGDAPARHLAYLTDRICVNEGRPQQYGAQIGAVEDGRAVPWPIDDEERLDQRRAAIGLEPWAEYARQWDTLQ